MEFLVYLRKFLPTIRIDSSPLHCSELLESKEELYYIHGDDSAVRANAVRAGIYGDIVEN